MNKFVFNFVLQSIFLFPLFSGVFLVIFDSRDLLDLFAIFLLDLLGLLNMNLWLKFISILGELRK